MVDALSSALFAPEGSWSDQTRERANNVAFTPSPPLHFSALHASLNSLIESGEVSWRGKVQDSASEYAERFQYSFVLDSDDGAWTESKNLEPLIEVMQLLRKAMKKDPSLRGTKGLDVPCLLTYAHTHLNLENILVDAAGSLWLSNFAASGFAGLFEDAVKIIAEILFECFPVPFAFEEVKAASEQRLTEMFQLSDAAAARLYAAVLESGDTEELVARVAGDRALANTLPRIASQAVSKERSKEASTVLETLLAPITQDASEDTFGVKRVPTILDLAKCAAPDDWSAHAKLTFKLITTVMQFSYDLTAKCSQREQAQSTGKEEASYLAEDLHIVHFLLPLLRLSLQSLTDRTLSIWQKRAAWSSAQIISAASCEVLRRPATAPASYSHRSKRLMLAPGQIVSLRTSESRVDGGAGTSFPMIVGERGREQPMFDACSHVVLPWAFRESGGASAAVIECGALHDFQKELPVLARLKKEIPAVPPSPSKFDIPPKEMTRVTEYLLSNIDQVRQTCQTPAVSGETDRAKELVEARWAERCEQRALFDHEISDDTTLNANLIQELNLLQGDRWRMEALQKKREVEIEEAKHEAIKQEEHEKASIDMNIALERRKILKYKQRLLEIKTTTKRRMAEQTAAEREADKQAMEGMKQRMNSGRDETLEEQANRERAEAEMKKRRSAEDKQRRRLEEEELREKTYIQKQESEARRRQQTLQLDCAQVDKKLGAARELIEDKVRVLDGEKMIEAAWKAEEVEEHIAVLRSMSQGGVETAGTSAEERFDDCAKGHHPDYPDMKKFTTRHPKIVSLLRQEVLIEMEEKDKEKKGEEKTAKDPFIDKIIAVRYRMDEFNATNDEIAENLDRELVVKKHHSKVAESEARLRGLEEKQQRSFVHFLSETCKFDLERSLLLWCLGNIAKGGSAGARDYAEGQQLIVHCADGAWRDAVVLESPSTSGETSHRLLIDSDDDVWEEGDSFGTETTMTLHPSITRQGSFRSQRLTL